MKNIKLIPVISALLVLAVACKQKATPQQLIVKRWRLVETNAPMPDSLRQRIISQTVFEFTADSQFSIIGIGRLQTGTYDISPDGKVLTIRRQDRSPEPNDILILTGDTLKVLDRNTQTYMLAVPR